MTILIIRWKIWILSLERNAIKFRNNLIDSMRADMVLTAPVRLFPLIPDFATR